MGIEQTCKHGLGGDERGRCLTGKQCKVQGERRPASLEVLFWLVSGSCGGGPLGIAHLSNREPESLPWVKSSISYEIMYLLLPR